MIIVMIIIMRRPLSDAFEVESDLHRAGRAQGSEASEGTLTLRTIP